jgi:hypothetical protein
MIGWILGMLLMGTTAATPEPHGTRRAAASATSATPIACRMEAFTGAERTRHAELLSRLLARVRGTRELPNGYRFALDAEPRTLAETAEWIGLERRCCPFFGFALAWSEPDGTTLTITGPPDAKTLIAAMAGGAPPAGAR